jgi:hypothetical protein
MRVRWAFALFAVMMFAVVAVAQDRVSLKPGFKPGDENRYSISAVVETAVTAKGADGIGGTSRAELTATVLLRTLSLTDAGEANQEAIVEAISFNSGKTGGVGPPSAAEVAGKKIVFVMAPSGYLSKCTIPDSRGYLALADLLFSLARWRPAGEVAVGESWEAGGRGHLYTDKLSEISVGASTVHRLASLSKGIASVDGTITLNQTGSSVFNPGGGFVNVGVIANGKGTATIEVDASTGRLIGGATETRAEGALVNVQPTAAGEKMQPREGSFVETSRFSVKLIQ